MADSLPSKAQLDKLGDRLRSGARSEADLRALDEYRRSFRHAYDTVVTTLKNELELEGTGRPAKTTSAIVDKLLRQNIRLTQIQDIAGIRIVVDGMGQQNLVVQQVLGTFDDSVVVDRRLKPSHGYRAVHIKVTVDARLVEIQVRTREQHLWAELSEKLADTIDPSLKYGGGPADTLSNLIAYSQLLQGIENVELDDIAAKIEVVKSELEFQRMSPDDPERIRKAPLLAELRSSQEEGERYTTLLKKSLATLLTDYYNEISQGKK